MLTLSMAAQSSNPSNTNVNLSQKLKNMISGGSLDYNSWISLILEIEAQSPEDINTISSVYDSFLSTFPLCHWHLDKYANHRAKMCGAKEAVSIYERGARMTMYSVGFWVDYFTFAAASFGNPEDVRRLFIRAVSFVDKDYFCHALWDKYMKYEFDLQGWSFLAHSYINVLRFPTKKLQFYYENFKQFVANLEEEMRYENNNGAALVEQVPVPNASTNLSKEISLVIKDLLDSPTKSVKSKALDKYKSIGEKFYHEACHLEEKIKCFEKNIKRRYFLATPLDDDELSNWHLYLDFIEKQGNMNWVMKLYERCLIPCAYYPEFWMRYVEFLESKGGRELAISSLDRATQIFLKDMPEIHLFIARFKEHVGDVSGARSALTLCDTKTDSSFVENVVMLANLERRLGNFAAASNTFKKALKNAKEKQKTRVLPNLYFHFAQLTFLTTSNTAAARDVLIEGLRDVPCCKFLLEELIKFAMTHEGASQVNIIDPIIEDAISIRSDEHKGLSAKDRENISHLFLEFVNLCGTMHDIRKAWNRHIKLFPYFLRMKPTTHKHSTSYSRDSEMDPKGKETVFESSENHETCLDQVLRKLSPQKDEPGSRESVPSARDQEKSKQMDIVPVLATQPTKEITLTPNDPTQRDEDVQEVKETDEAGPKGTTSNQITQSSSKQQWQGQSMSQMLYHYHQQQQQQLLQQQYQQQYQMQYNYSNQQQQQQQSYQMPSHQQHYGPQPIPSYQPPQQNGQQSKDVAYQAQLLAYQQQLLQYQQYQGYQLQQQQSMEGPSLMQEQHNSGLNQRDSKKGPPEYNATAESSESPHLSADWS